MTPATLDALKLMTDGALALAEVEAAGIRIDEDYLERASRKIERQVKAAEGKLRADPAYKVWRRVYGEKTNLGSRVQLARVLHEELGHKVRGKTKTGRPEMNEEALKAVGTPFTRRLLRLEKLKKLRGTYLEGIRREVIGGFLHPFFNLHTVSSYRSSSSEPNFQNLPIRDPKAGKIIRRAFVPRPGHALVEIDYSGIEVRIAACYNKDPRLIGYINDPKKDMHRDMAAQCFLIDRWEDVPEDARKKVRYVGKNGFVFPAFYGSVWFQIAPAMWEAAAGLAGPGGVPMREHLAAKGVRGLGRCDKDSPPEPGTFGAHLKRVEDDFWGRRFRVYADWKDRWVAAYREEAGFSMLTGFRCAGLYRRNEVINLPVQGSAFHCLLKSLILGVKEIRRRKMGAKIVGQIHDSIVADVPLPEVADYIFVMRRIMTEDVPRLWPWIVVPLAVEVEVAERNWYEKEPWSERWRPSGN